MFPSNIDEDQKKVLPSEHGALDIMPYGKSVPGYCIMLIKSLGEGLRLQLLEQNPLISSRLCI